METYEELNSAEITIFDRFCEETLLLDDIIPDSFKIFVNDAILELDSFTIKERHCCVEEYEKIKEDIREKQIEDIVTRINLYNLENKRPWIAGKTELSKQPYEIRERVLGLSPETCSGGFEYYVGGFFVVGHDSLQMYHSREADPYVDSFDWRNRHGKNWITPVEYQGFTNYCMPFATVGVLEALTKLYYNNADLEIDLSEQEIASCADCYAHQSWQGFSAATVLNYVTQHGVCDESSYPFAYPTIESYSLIDTLICESDNIEPNQWIKPNTEGTVPNSITMYGIKHAIISYGPLISGWNGNNISNGHAMALVGFGKVLPNDSLYEYSMGTNNISYVNGLDNYIGSTYWIFKNSYGVSENDNGYRYIIFPSMVGHNSDVIIHGMSLSYCLGLPLTSLTYNDDDIIIEDADGDGFYTWGFGEKPEGCPSWIPNLRDEDDSDNTKARMDDYGHLHDIPLRSPWVLTSDECLNNTEDILYNAIVIPSGYTLTISGSIMCVGSTSITVEPGGNLVVDGGILANSAINLSPSSTVTIKNGGIIYMRKDNDFLAPLGCIVNIQDGEIRGPYVKKSEIWN